MEDEMADPFEEKISELMKEAEALLESLNAELGADADDRRRIELESARTALRESRRGLETAAKETSEEKAEAQSLTSGYHEAIEALVKAIKDTTRLFS
jgi:hypothetical protein